MVSATTPVIVREQYLWKDGERFLVRGVVFQANSSEDFSPGGRDLVSDDRLVQLQHDVRLFQELGLNAIYIYSIDPTKSHVKAMKLLEEAGIYVLIGLSSPQHCIHRHDPYTSYNVKNLTAFFQRVDAMASFPNTLGFLVADHLINNLDSEKCVPVIRAVVRDLKKYMQLRNQACGQRVVPVGLGGASYKDDRRVLNGMTIGDEDSCVDFWTCTGYEWNAKSDGNTSGYDALIEKYRGISVPIIMTEYGAGNTTKAARTFNETTALYSPKMTEVFSGGCVYELWQSVNTYGLAIFERKGFQQRRSVPKPGRIAETRENEYGTLQLFEDFMNYKEKLASSTGIPTGVDGISSARRGIEKLLTSSEDTGIGGKIPESCVDWLTIEEQPRNDHQLA